jgi:hypothetical protein
VRLFLSETSGGLSFYQRHAFATRNVAVHALSRQYVFWCTINLRGSFYSMTRSGGFVFLLFANKPYQLN